LNTDVCKSESRQSHESRDQLTDSSNACSKHEHSDQGALLQLLQQELLTVRPT